ncbi:MAG: sulfotransferase domain-containing protein [Pseudomonadota bacterium]
MGIGSDPSVSAGLPTLSISECQTLAAPRETSIEIVVAGPQRDDCVASLLKAGIVNIFDGNGLMERFAGDRPLSLALPDLHIGPITNYDLQLGEMEAMRIPPSPFAADEFPPHALCIVNSMPKSGTVWMAALLEEVFSIKARHQILISHCADITADWRKPNVVGAVAMVRDLRDVVVSWFHHLARTDLAMGHSRPRYPSVERFYNEMFLGTINASPRYFRGALESWLDMIASHYIPIVRYEDLWQNSALELARVLDAWQVTAKADSLEAAIGRCAFERIAQRPRKSGDYISEMLKRGHLRRGAPGAWQDELPADIAQEVARRFAGYQSRLGY